MDYRTADLATRLMLARSTDTSAEVLTQMAGDEEKSVREAITLNPNTPEKSLRKLGEEFPDALVENPIFGRQLIADPESSFVLLAMALSRDTSAKALKKCAQSTEREILIAVAKNENTPLSVLEHLVSDPPVLAGYDYAEPEDYTQIFQAIAQNPNTPSNLLSQISEQWRLASKEIAQNPRTPVNILEKFAGWKNYEVHMALAHNPATPSSIIEKLLLESADSIREIAKHHPNRPTNADEIICFIEERSGVSIDLLNRLAAHPLSHIRLKVTKHENASTALLEKLVQDPAADVVLAAAHHSEASTAVVEMFAKFLVAQISARCRERGKYEQEVSELIDHPKVTEAALDTLISIAYDSNKGHYLSFQPEEKLAKLETTPAAILTIIHQNSKSPLTRLLLAQNPATPEGIVNSIFVDVYSHFQRYQSDRSGRYYWQYLSTMVEILHQVIQHQNLSEKLLDIAITSADLRLSAFKSPNLSEAMMRQILASPEDPQRSALAGNPNLPADIQQCLANDRSVEVRTSLAKNPTVATPLLEELSRDSILSVRTGLAFNDRVPSRLIDPEVVMPELTQISVQARQQLAKNENASNELLLRLAADEDVTVRVEIATRQNLTAEIVQKLAETSLAQLVAESSPSEGETVLALGLAAHPAMPEQMCSQIIQRLYG